MKAHRLLVLIAPTAFLLASVPWLIHHPAPSPSPAPRSAAPQIDLEPLPPGGQIVTALAKVRNPVAMAFAPDGRWFFTERTTGWVMLVDGGSTSGVYHAPTIGVVQSERGLLGIALDPDFAANGYVYIIYTSAESVGQTGRYDNRVVRFTLQGAVGVSPTLLLAVPLESNSTLIHNGGNLHFGPDGKLYVSLGDYFNAGNGQNLGSLPAKLHRFDPTVPLSAPADNPFYDGAGPNADSIYAYGFRNPFDFDFDPVSGALFAGDNGVACDDEVNRVLPGYNYGWRSNYPECDDSSGGGPDPVYNTIPPLIHWPTSVAPTGVMFYRGGLFPEWKDDLFVCHWKTGELHHFKLHAGRTAIAAHTIIAGVVCHLDVETGTDESIYFFRNGDYADDPNKEYRDILRLTRTATVYASTFAPSNPAPAAGEALTYTLQLVHYGTLTTTFSITAGLPPSTTLVDGTAQASGGAVLASGGVGITWTGAIVPGAVMTATYRVTVSQQLTAPAWLANTAVISTDNAGSLQLPAVVVANGQIVYLPMLTRSFMP